MDKSYDFSGWATRNDLKCSDGRTIKRDAFVDNDGQTVPLVWNHQHGGPANVIGHALLENRADGVYAYCSFNETDTAKDAKELVRHGDVRSLSIYANQLKHNGRDVIHGLIREVSLVLAGANPGAYIDQIMAHSEGADPDTEAVMYFGERISLLHSEEEVDEEPKTEEAVVEEEISHADEEKKEEKQDMAEKTVKDVYDEMTEEQKEVVNFLVGTAVQKEKEKGSQEDKEDMKHNVFENDQEQEVLTHADMEEIFADAKRFGSLSESCLQHGITNIEYLFPDARTIQNAPDFIKREDEWVSTVMNGTKHTPFSRIKSLFANITADDARARGYIKGHQKAEEVFPLLKRTTTPQTIYKLQKLDRDDIIDITDFDVVSWLKTEMRMMLNEEIARAILVGDGREAGTEYKINTENIRPIWSDADLYTIKHAVTVTSNDTDEAIAKKVIKGAKKARKNYKGSGNPVFFTTEDMLTDMMLIEDGVGRVIYDTEEKLRNALRCSKIVTVPVMENLTRTVDGDTHKLAGILVNLNDYNVGADKGGAVNMFDDFDIDYNKYSYLIETRCSGALIKPYSAIALEVVLGE